MTGWDWAEIFRAGWDAIPGKNEPAANALALALRAMELKAREIAELAEAAR
jgi:ABC-type amino acid transport system permease subunit